MHLHWKCGFRAGPWVFVAFIWLSKIGLAQCAGIASTLRSTTTHVPELCGSERSKEPARFGTDREHHIYSGEMILRAALTVVALFWNQRAVLHTKQDRDLLNDPGLIRMDQKIAEHLDIMAEAVVKKTSFPIAPTEALVDLALLGDSRYGEYVHNAISRYGELQAIVSSLSLQV